MTRVLLGAILIAAFGGAQSFEVASVRPAKNREAKGAYGVGGGNGARVTAININLLSLIERAFNLREYQVAGQDLKNSRYDIKARLPGSVGRTGIEPALQALLTDRFKMEFHREKKELPYYELVVGKGGEPKLKASTDSRPSFQIRGLYKARGQTMAGLCEILSRTLERVVVDGTGLTAKYDFVLDYAPGDPHFADPAGAKSIFTAVQEQLGLKLESRKGPVDVFVIDKIEKTPTAN
ncbi:MAG TPA: TIGR03435 family protein [Candidatus Solibacter sp.]|nr:TIGR03435 family protein [Candidatus Solibacter sp.]